MAKPDVSDVQMWFDQFGYWLIGSRDFALYRGIATDGAPLLLRVSARTDLAADHAAQLARECHSVTPEDAGWAVIPLALTYEQGTTALLLKDPGGIPLCALKTADLDLTDRLRLACGIAHAVRGLHGRDLIHRNLQPENILVDVESGVARLMGLGRGDAAGSLPQTPADPWPASLAYMAPEQTGRTGAVPDARSDLYALGIVLYELLAGRLPFQAHTPMEWIHAHLAREPRLLHELDPSIPVQLSLIIAKLLRKSADERYQSAQGLEADLLRCMRAARTGAFEIFPLGRFDPASLLRYSGSVIGRTAELAALLGAVEAVAADGHAAAVLVRGDAGVGKTALVDQVRRLLEPARVVFVAGKSDPVTADVPYSALKSALRALVERLLGEDHSVHELTKAHLRRVLADSGAIVAALVPEVEAIIGPTLPEAVAPEYASRRVLQAICRLFTAVTAHGHVLVLFMDDLQWTDAGTIELLSTLVEQGAGDRVLVIGALRTEATAATASDGPDAPTINAEAGEPRRTWLRRLGERARQISLAPLSPQDTHDLIASLIQADAQAAEPLAHLVAARTGGNPFAIGQFLYSLADDGLLTYDATAARWTWNAADVAARALSDTVAGLLVATLRKLSPDGRAALERLACLGSEVRDAVLSAAAPDDAPRLRAALMEAIQAGFVVRHDTGYRFTHDRIRDEAYAGIPAPQRADHHARIARDLQAHFASGGTDISIYEVVAHVNLASHAERERVDPVQAASLNLTAARQAKAAANYPAALGYARHGILVLPQTAGSDHPALSLALHMLAAECEILTGARAAADARLAALAARAQTLLDLGTITRLRVSLFTAMDRSDEAVRIGLAYLARLGPEWSPARSTSIADEYAQLMARLDGRSIESLADAPRMTDAVFEVAVEVLGEVMSPASFIDPHLHDLIPLRMANLSLEHGLAEASSFAFAHLAMVIGPSFGDYAVALRFGQLGLDLTERPGLDRFKAKVLMCFGNLILPWSRPAREGQPLIRAAFEKAKASGDVNFAAYSCNNLVSNMLLAGDPLPLVEAEIQWGLAYAAKVGLGRVSLILQSQLMLVRALRDGIGSATPAGTAAEAEAAFAGDPRLAVAEYCYWVRTLQMCVLARRFPEAQRAADRAGALLWTSPYFLETAEFHLYAGLAIALQEEGCSAGAAAAAAQVAVHRARADAWHRSCPDNFAAAFHLLDAEVARLDGRRSDAADRYERAIASARRYGQPHHEALASECAAAFHHALSLITAAEGYQQNAADAYAKWGATAQARQVRPGRARDPLRAGERLDPFGSAGTSLDIGTVLRCTRALSEEIVLDALIERLLQLALENAGADRGALLLLQDGQLTLIGTAQTHSSGIVIHVPAPPGAEQDVPRALINRVARTRQSLILDGAQVPEGAQGAPPGTAPATTARSVLGVPLLKRGELVGVLYMENHLSPKVFAVERLSILEMIGAQAAISIENARLYDALQQDVARRIAVEEDLRRSRAFLAAAQAVSQVGSWFWDEGAHAVVWSDEQFRLLGYDPTETAPSFENFWARLHPDDLEAARRTLETALRTQSRCSAAFRIVRPDGTVRYMESLSTPVPRPHTRVCDVVGTLMDVTERLLAEENLQIAEAELARVSRLTTMGQLMASIAHEINQPLAAIVTNASAGMRWLDRSPPDIEEARALLTRVADQGKRAGDIIRGLRALANKSGTEMVAFPFKEALDEVLALTGTEIRRHRVTLLVNLSPPQPVVYGDRVQIQQVLINLVMNAVEAMIDGDGPRSLSIRAEAEADGRLRVEIADTGSGLSPEAAARIFDAFFTTKAAGMGMGLSICRSIVEAHGGRLVAAPREIGTVFSFSLASGAEAAT